MHYKTNRQNHDFQIAYFLAGACHTPDAAYALLCDLRDDRALALEAAERVKSWKFWRRPGAVEADVQARNVAAAKAELATIQKCMDILQPMRKFAHLPDAQAHEAAQHDEWRLELIHRAENCLLTGGGIPADQFATMRMHPEFLTSIMPAIEATKVALRSPETRDRFLLQSAARKFSLPLLLEAA